MLEYITNRVTDFNVGHFVNELATASKNLGILEAKIDSYQFNSILIPMLQKKEAISSNYVERVLRVSQKMRRKTIWKQVYCHFLIITCYYHFRTMFFVFSRTTHTKSRISMGRC